GRGRGRGVGSHPRRGKGRCGRAGGEKGKKRKGVGIEGVLSAPIQKPPRNPDEAARRIDRLVGDVPRIELFAREQRPGWASWGNETQKFTAAETAMTVELRHEPAHSKFGGSSAPRILNCTASVGLVQKVPTHLRKVSAYADRGTALHAAIALLLAEDAHAPVESLAGKTFGSYTITPDDVENALRPAYAYVETLLDVPGAEYYLEQRVIFPTIPDTWGT